MFERILNYAKFSEKLTFFTPPPPLLLRKRMFAYQGGGGGEARNVSLSEILAYVLSEWSHTIYLFYLIIHFIYRRLQF